MDRLNRNLYVMLQFTKQPKTPGMTSKKNIAFPEGNKLLAGNFVLIWMKRTLIWFNLQSDGLEIDCLTLRRLLQKVCSYQCQFCTNVWAFSSLHCCLSSSHDGWAKCKEKVPDLSDPNQNVKTRSHSKLKFT